MKKKILVTGANGLIGSSIKAIQDYYLNFDFVFLARNDLSVREHDLTNQLLVKNTFLFYKPDYVLHCAARTGGVELNLASPAQQFTDNVLMNTFVIDEACQNKVEKLIAFSSACIFSSDSEILSEENFHEGQPVHTHAAYGYSKRMIDVQFESYKRQHNFNGCSVIPVNIFGEGDNYNFQNATVVPSLIHKFFLAKQKNVPVEIWGDGSPRRNFIYSKDVARICLDLFSVPELPQRLILPGVELSIRELVEKLSKIFNYDNVVYGFNKIDSPNRRQTNCEKFNKMFPNYLLSDIDESLENSVDWFIQNYPNVRK